MRAWLRKPVGCSRRVALLALLFCFIGVTKAERLPVKIYTSADGLGSSAAFSLVRDPRGFIWLCSRDGLVRFDGYRFITYRIGNDNADPAVANLLPTHNSGYWIDLNRGTDYSEAAGSQRYPATTANGTDYSLRYYEFTR
jgi:ligand-binding sensor domain-containing protein